MRPSLPVVSILLSAGLLSVPLAKADGRAAPIDFARDIRPILEAHCLGCHGPKKQRGDLRLDLKAAAMKGGESGPVIVPGKSADSILLSRVSSNDPEMRTPSSGERLTAEQIKLLRAWIDQGATWTETTD